MLIQQTVGNGDSFLFDGENLLKVCLGFFQSGFFSLAGRAILLQSGLDLVGRGVVPDRVLQRFQFRTGSATESAPTSAAATTSSVVCASSSSSSAASPKSTSAPETNHCGLRVKNLLNTVLNGFPLGLVLNAHLFLNSFKPLLLELSGVKVSSPLPLGLILRGELACADAEQRGNAGQCQSLV